MRVNQVQSFGGSVRLTVRESAALDEDLTVGVGKLVHAGGGTIELLVGDDISIAGQVIATGAITIRGDHMNADPGTGSTIHVLITGNIAGQSAEIRGLVDNDLIALTNVASNTPTTLLLDAGNDLVYLGSHASPGGNAGGSLNFIRSSLTVSGQAGSDTIVADETGETAGNTGNLTSTKLTGLGVHPQGVTYGTIEELYINLGQGGDSLTIPSIAANVLTEVHGNDGPDTLTISALVASGAVLNVFGDGGIDQMFANTSSLGVIFTAYGGPGNDIFTGGAGNDKLYGGPGDDILNGLGGDDLIEGENGDDTLNGGAGQDIIFGRSGNDFVHGGAGNDLIVGGEGDDDLSGDEDQDVIWGGDEGLLFSTFFQPGNLGLPPRFTELESNPQFHTGFVAPVVVPILLNGKSFDGDALDGRDKLNGGSETDWLFGGGDVDQLDGGLGDDFVDGGAGSERPQFGGSITGGAGNDVVFGGANDDAVHGGPGIDQVYGDDGSTLTLGHGDDLVFGDGNESNPTENLLGQRLFGDGGNDELFAYAATVISTEQSLLTGDQLLGGPGNDRLYGNLRKDLLIGENGNDNLYGDRLAGPTYADSPSPATVGADDVLVGGSGEDLLYGGGGNDRLWGGANPDWLEGQDGFDQVNGGTGVDTLVLDATYQDGDGNFHFYTRRGDAFDGDADFDSSLLEPATDILLINGTHYDDSVFIGENEVGITSAAEVAANGQLTGGDASFTLSLSYADGVGNQISISAPVSLPAANTSTNASIDHLVADLNMAINSTALAGHLAAGRIGNRLNLLTVGGKGPDAKISITQANSITQSQLKFLIGDQGVPTLTAEYTTQSVTTCDGQAAPLAERSCSLFAVWRDRQAKPLVEQFSAAGLGGDDTLAFTESADFSDLTALSDEWIGVFNGGPGNDTLIGGTGRDRLDGGPNDDKVYGYGGDDRLFGSEGDDELYGGQGDDDLLGGEGNNFLFAWSFDPLPEQCGVFFDPQGGLHHGDGGVPYPLEDTGLNRMLGGPGNDFLFAGTGVDFLYGNGGTDTLYQSDCTPFSDADAGLIGDAWKEFAKQNAKVWYYAGSNKNDLITVDFVSEPGALSDHHLITRLTNNNGNYTFDAQLRLDFNARDENDDFVWDPVDLSVDFTALQSEDPEERAAAIKTIDMSSLLPPESDFQVLLIDALDGNDQVTVGPTVQKTVWVDGGLGDDHIQILSGNVILSDQTEVPRRNDLANDAAEIGPAADNSAPADPISTSLKFTGLTIDNPRDVDFYTFQISTPTATVELESLSQDDDLTIELLQLVDGQLGAPSGAQVTLQPIVTVADQLDRDGQSNDQQASAYPNQDPQSAPLARVEDQAILRGLTLHSASDVDWFRFDLTYAETASVTSVDTPALQLTSNAHFTVQIGSGAPVNVTLRAAATDGTDPGSVANSSFDDLVADVNQALDEAGLSTTVTASRFISRIRFSLLELGSDQTLTVAANPLDPAVTALHLVGAATPSITGKPPASIALKRLDPVSGMTITLYGPNGVAIPVPMLGDNGQAISNLGQYQGQIVDLKLDGLAKGEYWVEVRGPSAGRYELFPKIGQPSNSLLDLTGAGKTQLELSGLDPAATYLIRIESANQNPTIYSLSFTVDANAPEVIDLAAQTDVVRRDVILGGPGNDRLSGGPSEDWVLGGPGDDVLTGGLDAQAGDLLFGEGGNDTFQIIPDRLPFLKGTQQTYAPAMVDELFGGDGADRVLFLGGNFDQFGRPVPDEVAIGYDRINHRYEFTSLVWDTANQRFLADPLILVGMSDAPQNGQISNDVKFSLIVDGEAPIPITLPAAATNGMAAGTLPNQTVADLEDDLNAVLATAGLSNRVKAARLGNRIAFQRINPGIRASLDLVAPNETTTRELHLVDSIKSYNTNRRFEQAFAYYQAREIERTVIATQAGNDVVHGAPEFKFQYNEHEWGIATGDFQQRATIAGLEIFGGEGADQLFGGAWHDYIDGGPGDDFVFGLDGDDQLFGGGGTDLVIGRDDVRPDRFETVVCGLESGTNANVNFASQLEHVAPGSVIGDLTLHLDDLGDWYILPTPTGQSSFGATATNWLRPDMIHIQFEDPAADAVFHEYANIENALRPVVLLFAGQNNAQPGAPPHILPAEQAHGVPDFYLLHVVNPYRFLLPAAGNLPTNGKLPISPLPQDVNFTVRVSDANGEQDAVISLTAATTTANSTASQLVAQLDAAIQTAFPGTTTAERVSAKLAGQRVTLVPPSGAKVQILAANDATRLYLQLQAGQSMDDPVPSLGKYSISISPPQTNDPSGVLGQTIDVPADIVLPTKDPFNSRGIRTESSIPGFVSIVAPLGDIDGDGQADYIAAVREDTGDVQDYTSLPAGVHPADQLERTLARVYLGQNAPADLTLDANSLTLALPAPLQTPSVFGSQAYVTSAGDLNNDGIDDLAIAVSLVPTAATEVFNLAEFEAEGVYILFGRSNWAGTIDVVEQADIVLESKTSGLAHAKLTVSGVGDFNGDQIDDLLIGHQPFTPMGQIFATETGAAYLFYGRTDWESPQPLFHSDFESTRGDNVYTVQNTNGLQGYVDGLWHRTSRRGGDSGHSGTNSFYFGREIEGDYDIGKTKGLISSRIIDMTGVTAANLTFNYFLATEDSTFYDRARVLVRHVGSSQLIPLAVNTANQLVDPTGTWHSMTIDMSEIIEAFDVDRRIQVVFDFDTFSNFLNDFEGFYVDDVVVQPVLTLEDANVKFFREGAKPPGDYLGTSVAGVGDLNGDGRSDLAILAGQISTTGGLPTWAQAYVYFGRTTANALNDITVHPDFAPAANGADWKIRLPFPIDQATSNLDRLTIKRVGNLNGDQANGNELDDLLITGAVNDPLLPSGSSNVSFIAYGTAGAGGQLTLTTPILQELVPLFDVNGDGFDDLGIFGREKSPTYFEDGSQYAHAIGQVFLGNAAIAAETFAVPDVTIEPVQARYVQISGPSNSPLSNVPTLRAATFGSLGDINADGRADLGMGDSLGAGLSAIFGQPIVTSEMSTSASKVPQRFVFDLATQQVARRTLGPAGVDLTGREPVNLNEAPSLEGSTSAQMLAQAQHIGDINDDGVDDLLIAGANKAYVLFGPIEFTAQDAIEDRATLVADLTTLGQPAARMGDLNGDGIDDLIFVHFTSTGPGPFSTKIGNYDVNVIYGRRRFESRNLAEVSVDLDTTFAGFIDGMSLQAMNFDGDEYADLLLNWNRLADPISSPSVHSWLISGKRFVGADSSLPAYPASVSPATISANSAFNVITDLTPANDLLEQAIDLAHLFSVPAAPYEADLDNEGTLSSGLPQQFANAGFTLGVGATSKKIESDGINTTKWHILDGSRRYTVLWNNGRLDILGWRITPSTSPRAQAIVAGDLNGDGLEDLAFSHSGLLSISGSTSTYGRVYVLNGRTSNNIPAHKTFVLADPAGIQPLAQPVDIIYQDFGLGAALFALGDVNRDGYDDLGVSRSNESSTTSSFEVFYGGKSGSVDPFQSGREGAPLSGDISVRRELSANIPNGVFLSGALRATAGDFDKDGSMDLALGEPVRTTTNGLNQLLEQDDRGHLYVFWNVADTSTQMPLMLNGAGVTLQGSGEHDRFGTLPAKSQLDLNGDRYDDLVVGAGLHDLFTQDLTPRGGKTYFFHGAPREFEIPQDSATTLVNRTVTGSGDFVVDAGNGPFVQNSLAEGWYKFTTLGDGSGGSQLRVWPVAEEAQSRFLGATDGLIVSAQPPFDIDRTGISFTLGGDTAPQLVLESDLAGLLPYIGATQKVSVANLQLEYANLHVESPYELGPSNSNAGLEFLDKLVFFAPDKNGVKSLWITNGTSAGTDLLHQFPASATLSGLTKVGNTFYFTDGNALWESQGIAGSTNTVRNTDGLQPSKLTGMTDQLYFYSGRDNLIRRLTSRSLETVSEANALFGTADFVPASDTLYIITRAQAPSIWVTRSGSLRTDQLSVSLTGRSITQLTTARDQLYFRAGFSSTEELWTSDGTNARTLRLLSGLPNGTLGSMIGFENELHFARTDPQAPGSFTIHRTGGQTISPTGGSFERLPQNLTVVDDELYFATPAGNGERQPHLWSYQAGGFGEISLLPPLLPSKTFAANGQLYFVTGSNAVWTMQGRTPVKLLQQSLLGDFKAVGKKLFFTSASDVVDWWWTGGTIESTDKIEDTGPFEFDMQVQLLADEGDGAVNSLDINAPLAATFNIPVTLDAADGVISIDVTDRVRTVLASGRTRVTWRAKVSDPLVALPVRRWVHGGDTGMSVSLERQDGYLVDLYDADGGLIAAGKPVVDMRSLEAVTYFVRIFNPFATAPGAAATLEIVAPEPGDVHSPSDRDLVDGGEGDDIIAGSRHLDRLFGRSGQDAFVAEVIEVFDRENNESLKFLPPALPAGDDSRNQPLPTDFVVNIPDDALAQALAGPLNIPVTTSYLGSPLLHLPFYASDLNMLTRLEASKLGIADLSGTQHATNLLVVNLASNSIDNITPIRKGTDDTSSPVGWFRAEYLAFDDNRISSIQPLELILDLKGLSIDYNAVTDIGPLDVGFERDLQFLSIDGRPSRLAPLPGLSMYEGFGRLDTFYDEQNPTSSFFGSALTTLRSYVAVGSPGEAVGAATNAGVVRVYDTMTGELVWTINNPDSVTPSDDRFGSAVAVVGDKILVGAPDDEFPLPIPIADTGSVYVFDIRTQTQLKRIVHPLAKPGAHFGFSVSAAGADILVGAPFERVTTGGDFNQAGAIYVMHGNSGKMLRRIENPEPGTSDRFGSSVTSFGDMLLTGATFDNPNGISDAGSVYAFDAPTGKWLWRNSIAPSGSQFGTSLDVHDGKLAVGSRFDISGSTGSGAAYVIDLSTQESVKINAPSPIAGDRFGESVTWVGDRLLVGAPFDAPGGTAYLFDLEGQDPVVPFAGKQNALVGWTATAVDTHLLIGAPFASDSGVPNSGAAYLYEGVELSDLNPLRDLHDLQWLSLSGNQIRDTSPLVHLDELKHLYLHDNRIADISSIDGARLIDNGDPGYSETGTWLGNIHEAPQTFENDYRFHSPGTSNDFSEWSFEDLPAGKYEVFVTWPQDPSHAKNAQYSLFDGNGADPAILTKSVDQRVAPATATISGKPWQSLGSVSIASDSLRVRLAISAEQFVAADAVMIRAVEKELAGEIIPALPGDLETVTLQANPLNNRAHELFIPDLIEQGIDVRFDPNQAPLVQPFPGPVLVEHSFQEEDEITYLQIDPLSTPSPTSTRALRFMRDNDVNNLDYVDLPEAALHNRSNMTVEFWLSTTETGSQGIVSAANAGDHNEYLIFLQSSQELRVYRHGVFQSWNILDRNIADGGWHHYAVVHDAVTNLTTVFIDGIDMGSRSQNNSALNVQSLLLGQDQDTVGGGFQTSQALSGNLGHLVMWKSARSASDVRKDRAGYFNNADPNLAGYWKFAETFGFTVTDSSPNGFHGVLGNGSSTAKNPTRVAVPNLAIARSRFDSEGDPLFFTATSNHPGTVDVWIEDGLVFAGVPYDFEGHVEIYIEILDGPSGPGDFRGRSDSIKVDLVAQSGSIYGSVFNDDNRDGLHNVAESTAAGTRIYIDRNNNGQFDANEYSTFTDINGDYALHEFSINSTHRVGMVTALPVEQTWPALQVMNGGFESGLASWTSVGQTSIATAALGITPPAGTQQARIDSASTATIGAVESAANLNGATLISVSQTITNGSVLTQDVSVPAGARITFDWALLTEELPGHPDFVFFSASPVTLNSVSPAMTVLAHGGTPTITGAPAPFVRRTNYQSFTYTFPKDGVYRIAFGSVSDQQRNTVLLVDRVQLSTGSLLQTVEVGSTQQFTPDAVLGVDFGRVSNNIAPVVNDQSFTIAENSSAGTIVGSISASDANSGDLLSFEILAGSGKPFFKVAKNGGITVAPGAQLDFESITSYLLLVEVTDQHNRSDTATVTINLTNVNEAPVMSAGSYSIAENSPVGTLVGTLTAFDVDAGDSHMFLIDGGSGETAFSVHATSGQITVADSSQLDFENTKSHTLVVSVRDAAGLLDAKTLTIQLTGVNEPPVLSASTLSVPENAIGGSIIGTVGFSDPDSGDLLQLSILGGTGQGVFELHPSTGAISLAAGLALDFETRSQYTLEVQATDSGSLTVIGTVTINVTNVNEPPSIQGPALTVTEHSPAGTIVGTVVASDPDANTTLMFEIVGGTGANAFAIGSQSGVVTVTDPVLIDFETAQVLTLDVQVSDGQLTALTSIAIQISNVGEAPRFNDQLLSVAEGSPLATILGTLVAEDPDLNESFSFAITGGTGAAVFTLDSSSGTVSVLDPAALNFESIQQFTLAVQVTDSFNLSDNALITIQVVDVNETPLLQDVVFSVADNAANGTFVGKLQGIDPDAGESLSYSLEGGNGSSVFSLNSQTGQITVSDADQFAFAGPDGYTLLVRVSDDGGLFDDAVVTIQLEDVNDPPEIEPQSFTIAENSPIGTPVGVVSAQDGDAGDVLSYSIVGGTGQSSFSINAVTGAITVNNVNQLDAESLETLTIEVRVTDAGGLASTAVISIDVQDVNEPPTVNDLLVSIPPNSPNGSFVVAVVASDPDFGSSLSFSITSGNTNNAFAINAANGQITVNNQAALAQQLTGIFELQVKVQDSGGLMDTGTIVVQVEIGTVNVTGATTLEDTQTTAGLVITPVSPSSPATHVQITGISGGQLFQSDGVTPIVNGAFISLAQGASGLRFTPAPNSSANGSFLVQASTSNNASGLFGSKVAAQISVQAVNDPPSFVGGPNVTAVANGLLQSFPAWAQNISPAPAGILPIPGDEVTQSVSFMVVSNDNASLFASGPSLDSSGNLSFTLVNNVAGTATIGVKLKDNGGVANGGVDESPIQTFTIKAIPNLAVWVVTTTADSGAGSLREAIESTNFLPGQQSIHFDLSGANKVIQPTTPLPGITDSVVIDARTQPGYTNNPLVTLNGSLLVGAAFDGLTLSGNYGQVRGLSIVNFTGDGIELSGSNALIAENYIGLNTSGAKAANAQYGLRIKDASGNQVLDNVISGNGFGGATITGVTSTNNLIDRNRIGTNPAGTTAIGNGFGIFLRDAVGNFLGTTGFGNVISGNTRAAVVLTGATATNNVVAGNRIGTNASGTAALANAASGVQIQVGAHHNIVEGNTISGNALHGIVVLDVESTHTTIRGNQIGTNLAGTAAIPNQAYGIVLKAPDTTIGGSVAGQGNTISGNALSGIALNAGADRTTIRGNRIGTNSAGTAAIANSDYGITVQANNNLIGGPGASDGNVISGNSKVGVFLAETLSHHNQIVGNRIGTNAAGTAAIQNGSHGVYLISGARDNLVSQNVISGNVGNGVTIFGATSIRNEIRGNMIGVNATGTATLRNRSHGVHSSSPDNIIGGSLPGQGNVISGNDLFGIVLAAPSDRTTVLGNRIGTSANGNTAFPNGQLGVFVQSSENVIGGLSGTEFNLISGNDKSGLALSGSDATSNQILGNRIGTNLAGTDALANDGYGIQIIAGASLNVVRGNLISGNKSSGLLISDATTEFNTVAANKIGVNLAGTAKLKNDSFGILLKAPRNTIGGATVADGNTISSGTTGISISDATTVSNVVAHNFIGVDSNESVTTLGMTIGVQITNNAANNTVGPGNVIAHNSTGLRSLTGGQGNRITQNRFRNNSVIGIDLGNSGPTANDAGDADSGANRLQNWPQLTSPALLTGNNLQVLYSVNTAVANATYPLTIEFFLNSGTGQGRLFLGQDVYSTADQAAGTKSILLTVPAGSVVDGNSIVATATDSAGNTSEFSAPALVNNSGGGGEGSGELSFVASRSPLDVNGDGQISPIDALLVINILNGSGEGRVSSASPDSRIPADVDGNQVVSPIDALLVINWLNYDSSAPPMTEQATDLAIERVSVEPIEISDELDEPYVSAADDLFNELGAGGEGEADDSIWDWLE